MKINLAEIFKQIEYSLRNIEHYSNPINTNPELQYKLNKIYKEAKELLDLFDQEEDDEEDDLRRDKS